VTCDYHKPPLPKVLTVAEFHGRFGTQAACLARLRELRWGTNLERFTCPACGHPRGWWLPKRELVECCDCHHQVSVTAGTVFHQLRSPLWKWFWAVYQLAQDKKGIAALELAKQIRVSYTTAWLMLHKLRRAMRQRNLGYRLDGLVEVDECYVGGTAEGTGSVGRGAAHKTAVGVAVELTPAGKPGRVALDTLPSVDGHSLRKFAEQSIAKGSTLRTDGWGAYKPVAKAGYQHKAVVTGSGPQAVQKFPWLHTFIGNLKRMILGTYHSVSPKHLARYLAEFAYRANRRWREASLFDRLLVAAVNDKAITYRQLVTGGS
jgi:transposase-like protein